MSKSATFRVDPKLATLLGENYRSTEQALKELIDNAWDADAENVSIQLPEPFTDAPIIVSDDGIGMTEQEVRSEYLTVASDRCTRKGELTIEKRRGAKGRKGIGKFAGFIAADVMEINTKRGGRCTKLRIVKDNLLNAGVDLESVGLPISVEECDPSEHGTTILLSGLNQRFSAPLPSVLKPMLVLEYGRQPDFIVRVNGEPLTQVDIPGQHYSDEIELPNAGKLRLNLTVMDKPISRRQAGIIVRVAGKVVGRPNFFGLEDREDVPDKLLGRTVGEVEADSLEEAVTADWGALIENSIAHQEARDWVFDRLSGQVDRAFKKEISLARARQHKLIKSRLEGMAEHRREFAREYIDRILQKFYGHSDERIEVVISLVLDALEKDDYWIVCRSIDEARPRDVSSLAEALDLFGLADLAMMIQQTKSRLAVLDALDALIGNAATREMELHKALENNLWVLGDDYAQISSNTTLAKVIEGYNGRKFSGPRASKRPDLLLTQWLRRKYILIEFKRPSDTVGRDAANQAMKYRDDLTGELNLPIEIVVIGGKVDEAMHGPYRVPGVCCLSYVDVVSTARAQLSWLLKELQEDRV